MRRSGAWRWVGGADDFAGPTRRVPRDQRRDAAPARSAWPQMQGDRRAPPPQGPGTRSLGSAPGGDRGVGHFGPHRALSPQTPARRDRSHTPRPAPLFRPPPPNELQARRHKGWDDARGACGRSRRRADQSVHRIARTTTDCAQRSLSELAVQCVRTGATRGRIDRRGGPRTWAFPSQARGATSTGAWVGTRLPPARSGVTIRRLTPLSAPVTPTSAAPSRVTLNNVRVGEGLALPRCSQTW